MQSLTPEYLDDIVEHFDLDFVTYNDTWKEFQFLDRLLSLQPKTEYDIACNLVISREIISSMMTIDIFQDFDESKFKFCIRMFTKISEYFNMVFKYASREVSDWVSQKIFIQPLLDILEYYLIEFNSTESKYISSEFRTTNCKYPHEIIYFNILDILILLCACGSLGYPKEELLIKTDKFMKYSFLQKRKFGNSNICVFVDVLEDIYSQVDVSKVLNQYETKFQEFALEGYPSINWSNFQSEFEELTKIGKSRSDSDDDFLS